MKKTNVLMVLAGITLSSQAAHAQIEEVVVTARKQEEKLQDVPLAISAFTSEQMSRHQIRDLSDIAKLTPGLNFEVYNGGSGTPVIRGASQQRVTDLDQTVSTFFNGIYLPRQYMVSREVLGLERVEVVKGPQSALYGRNAFMGAINYITRKPGDEFRGEGKATIGVYDRYDIDADVSGPIVEGKLFAGVAASYSTFDGDAKNGNPNANVDIKGGTKGRVGGWNNEIYQGRLVFTPTDELEFDFGAYRYITFIEQPSLVRVTRSDGDTNCGNVIGGRFALYCGELPWKFSPLPGGSAQTDVNIDPRGNGVDAKTTILNGSIKWSPADGATLDYIYGYAKGSAVSGGGSDRDPKIGSINAFAPTGPRGSLFQISPVGNVKYYSHEFRGTFDVTDSVNFIGGGIVSKLKDFDIFPLSYTEPILGTAPFNINGPGYITLTRGTTEVTTKAVFGKVDFNVTDEFRIAVEARYQGEDKDLVSGPTTFNPAVRTVSGTWTQFTPRFTVDYKLTPENSVYATVARGAKSGGFNLSAFVAAQNEYAPDKNWTYEIGSKNEFADGRLRLNGALFYITWANRQVTCSAAGAPVGAVAPGVVCNVGDSTVKGGEFDATYVPVDGLTLTAGFSYNDASYNNGVIDQRIRDFNLCNDVICRRNGDVSGKALERQSKTQYSLGADYEVPLTGDLAGFVGIDGFYKSKQFTDATNLTWLPSRFIADARFGVRADLWDVTAWVKNLTNEKYPASAFAIFAATDTQYVPVRGQARTAGVTARYHF